MIYGRIARKEMHQQCGHSVICQSCAVGRVVERKRGDSSGSPLCLSDLAFFSDNPKYCDCSKNFLQFVSLTKHPPEEWGKVKLLVLLHKARTDNIQGCSKVLRIPLDLLGRLKSSSYLRMMMILQKIGWSNACAFLGLLSSCPIEEVRGAIQICWNRF